MESPDTRSTSSWVITERGRAAPTSKRLNDPAPFFTGSSNTSRRRVPSSFVNVALMGGNTDERSRIGGSRSTLVVLIVPGNEKVPRSPQLPLVREIAADE